MGFGLSELGAILTCYRNKKATSFVVENFRKHFPDSPITLISDGGDSYEDVADKFSCSFFMDENLYGNSENNYPTLPYDSNRTLKWWERLRRTIDTNKTKYTMILEDDVYVREKFDIPELHLSGVRVGNTFSERMHHDIMDANPGEFCFRHYGMCGGSVFNNDTFDLIYDDVVLDIQKNHDTLINRSEGDYFLLGAVDANITYHFGKRGFRYTVAPWLAEKREPGWQQFPVVHQWKDHY